MHICTSHVIILRKNRAKILILTGISQNIFNQKYFFHLISIFQTSGNSFSLPVFRNFWMGVRKLCSTVKGWLATVSENADVNWFFCKNFRTLEYFFPKLVLCYPRYSFSLQYSRLFFPILQRCSYFMSKYRYFLKKYWY